MSTAKEHAYEALMSALYMNPFSEFLGERDLPEGHAGYFHIGEKPKDIRVTVLAAHTEEVTVKVEWRNHWADARNPLKGEQLHTIRTYQAAQADLEAATTAAIVAVLETYQDVLNEEGVAGEVEKLAPEAEDTDDGE